LFFTTDVALDALFGDEDSIRELFVPLDEISTTATHEYTFHGFSDKMFCADFYAFLVVEIGNHVRAFQRRLGETRLSVRFDPVASRGGLVVDAVRGPDRSLLGPDRALLGPERSSEGPDPSAADHGDSPALRGRGAPKLGDSR